MNRYAPPSIVNGTLRAAAWRSSQLFRTRRISAASSRVRTTARRSRLRRAWAVPPWRFWSGLLAADAGAIFAGDLGNPAVPRNPAEPQVRAGFPVVLKPRKTAGFARFGFCLLRGSAGFERGSGGV